MDAWRIDEQEHSKRLSELVAAFFTARRDYLRLILSVDPPSKTAETIAKQRVNVAELAMLECDLTSKGVE